MLENVMDLVRRGISEKGNEQRRDGEISRTVHASVGVRRHLSGMVPARLMVVKL